MFFLGNQGVGRDSLQSMANSYRQQCEDLQSSYTEVVTLEGGGFPWPHCPGPFPVIFPSLYTLALPRDPRTVTHRGRIAHNWWQEWLDTQVRVPYAPISFLLWGMVYIQSTKPTVIFCNQTELNS